MFYATFIVLGALWVVAMYAGMRTTFGPADPDDNEHSA
jgi:hypothetical protein